MASRRSRPRLAERINTEIGFSSQIVDTRGRILYIRDLNSQPGIVIVSSHPTRNSRRRKRLNGLADVAPRGNSGIDLHNGHVFGLTAATSGSAASQAIVGWHYFAGSSRG